MEGGSDVLRVAIVGDGDDRRATYSEICARETLAVHWRPGSLDGPESLSEADVFLVEAAWIEQPIAVVCRRLRDVSVDTPCVVILRGDTADTAGILANRAARCVLTGPEGDFLAALPQALRSANAYGSSSVPKDVPDQPSTCDLSPDLAFVGLPPEILFPSGHEGSVLDVVSAPDRQRVERLLRMSLRLGVKLAFEHDTVGAPIGRVRWSVSPTRIDGAEGLHCVCRSASRTYPQTPEARSAARRCRQLSELTGDLVCWRSEGGDVVHLSADCTHATGLTSRTLHAQPALLLDWVHPEDADAAASALFGEEPTTGLTFRLFRPDGTMRWMSLRSRPLEGRPGRYAELRDTTDETRAASEMEARRTSDELFAGVCQLLVGGNVPLVEAFGVVVGVVARFSGADRVFVDAAPRFVLRGQQRVAVERCPGGPGSSCSERPTADDVRQILDDAGTADAALFRGTAAGGEGSPRPGVHAAAYARVSYGGEADVYLGLECFQPGRELRTDAAEVLCSVGEVLACAVARETTAHRLAESEERYTLASTAGKAGVWELDCDSERLYVDPSLPLSLGYDPAHFESDVDRWADLVHPEDREHTQRALEQSKAEDGRPFSSIHRKRASDGSWRWIQTTGRSVPASRQRGQRVVGVDTDITHVKEMEAALRGERGALQGSVRERAGRALSGDSG